MTLGKKLDKIFKKHLSPDFRKDKQLYQDLFADVSRVACDEYDLVPWKPSDKEKPDHKIDVVCWLEPKEQNPEKKGKWGQGWYDWKHDMWVVQGARVDLMWNVTHWAYALKPSK